MKMIYLVLFQESKRELGFMPIRKIGSLALCQKIGFCTWLYARMKFVLKGFISTLHCKDKHYFLTDKLF